MFESNYRGIYLNSNLTVLPNEYLRNYKIEGNIFVDNLIENILLNPHVDTDVTVNGNLFYSNDTIITLHETGQKNLNILFTNNFMKGDFRFSSSSAGIDYSMYVDGNIFYDELDLTLVAEPEKITFGNNLIEGESLIGQGFVLKSPDGTRWRITVDNNGDLSAEQL